MEKTLNFNNNFIDKEVAEKLDKEVSSYIIEQVKNNMDNSIEERARLAAWQIFEEIVEIIAEKMNEQKSIDTENACGWLIEHLDLSYVIESLCGVPVASDNVELCRKRLESIKEITNSLRKAMEKN